MCREQHSTVYNTPLLPHYASCPVLIFKHIKLDIYVVLHHRALESFRLRAITHAASLFRQTGAQSSEDLVDGRIQLTAKLGSSA
jgi:hypothetical protein